MPDADICYTRAGMARRLPKQISNLQFLLFRPIGAAIRLWVWLSQRFVRYQERGALFSYIEQGQPCIVALWHQDVFPLMFRLFVYTRTWPCYFMVSTGRVGTIGGYLLGLWGVECVAGTRKKSGIAAVETLSGLAVDHQRTVFIMADGSRGPAREARWGAVHMAKATGLPIVATRAWGDNLIVLRRTWMKLVLNKPWGSVVLDSAEPLFVSADADKAELGRCRAELERRLNELVEAGEREFGNSSTG